MITTPSGHRSVTGVFRPVFGLCVLAPVALFTANAHCLSVQELERYLSVSLGQNFPVTFIGPLVAPDLSVSETDGGFSVSISGARFLSGQTAGDFSFKMLEREDGHYTITQAVLPDTLIGPDSLGTNLLSPDPLGPDPLNPDPLSAGIPEAPALPEEGGVAYPLTGHTLSGVWSMADSAYLSLEYALEGTTYATADSETTLTGLSLSVLPQREDGTQAFAFGLGPLSYFDTKGDGTLVFGGMKVTGDIKSDENLIPYRFLRGFWRRIAQDGAKILQDQSDLLQLLSPLYIPYDSAGLSVSAGKLVFEHPEQGVKYGFDSLTFNSSASALLQGKTGVSGFDLTLKGLHYSDGKNTATLSELRVFSGSGQIDGAHAFKYGREYLDRLNEPDAKTDMADAFALYLNFNDFSLQVELADFSATFADGRFIDLGQAGFGAQLLGLRSDRADLLLNISHRDITVPGMEEPVFQALMPEKSKLVLRLDDMPMSRVKENLKGQTVPVSLISGDDKALGEFITALAFQLLENMLSYPPRLQIEESYLDTPSLKVRLGGTFDIAPAGSALVAGHIDVYASGLKDLQKAVAAASRDTASGIMQKFTPGLLAGLGIVRFLGKAQDDGSLYYKISLDENGTLKVNNLPVPKF